MLNYEKHFMCGSVYVPTISCCKKFQDIHTNIQAYTKDEKIVPCIPKDPSPNYDNDQLMDTLVLSIPL